MEKLIWKVIISRLPAASLLTSGGTRRQRLHEFPKWSPGFCDSPAFVLPKFGLNFSQIKVRLSTRTALIMDRWHNFALVSTEMPLFMDITAKPTVLSTKSCGSMDTTPFSSSFLAYY